MKLYAGSNNVYYSNNYVKSFIFLQADIATFGKSLGHEELNYGSKGGKHFIQSNVSNFLSAASILFYLLCLKKKILCSLFQSYDLILISFFYSWESMSKFDVREICLSTYIRNK